MLPPVTKEISGFSVRFRPLPATKAFTLAKRVALIVLPLLKSFDLAKLNLKSDIDLNKLVDAVTSALAALPNEEAVELITDSLIGATITAPGAAPVEIQGRSDVDAVFIGELEAMYEIVFAAWKYNKLAPFKFAARFGVQIAPTDTSAEAATTETKFGPKLAM